MPTSGDCIGRYIGARERGVYAHACRPPRVCCAGGPLRCWPGGLAVCRAIGDRDCGAAIWAVPAVHTVTFDTTASGGGALIICSDGVWDALTQDQVAKYVRDCATAAEAAARVVDKATKARGLRDDITAAVAWLGTPPWLNKPNAGQRLLRRLSRSSGSRDSGSDSDLSPSPSPSPSSSPTTRRFRRSRANFEHSQSPASLLSTPPVLSPFCLQPSDAPSSPSELQIPPSQVSPSRVLSAPSAELNPSPGQRRRTLLATLPGAFARTLPEQLERLNLRPPG